ncbi:hypothetical protein ASE85_11155 [Sphingobium sp. Leaf26]|nr:hypothetical protein ASE85_11155 [Sphingobium sp. Leaf26]
MLEPKGRPFADVQDAGVVIHGTDMGRHAGFLYRRDDGSVRVLHLAFHHSLRDDQADQWDATIRARFGADLRWADLGLPDDSRVVFAAHLSQLLLGNPQIPYGLDAGGTAFTPDGRFVRGPVGKGLTCATFIAAVLAGYGHPVVMDNWQPRPEDQAWGEQILAMLEGRASQEHIDAVRADIGASRYRPEEVVGAAVSPLPEWPLSFPDAIALAEQIVQELA